MFLSISTQKNLRKWCDRFFITGQQALDFCAGPKGKRLLFTAWPEIEPTIRHAFSRTRHVVEFGPLPSGRGDYDVVIPVSIEALLSAANNEALSAHNPLPLPTPEVVMRCDDKAALNSFLRAKGFGIHVPRDLDRGEFPAMLKRRRDACARHAYRVFNPADEAAHGQELDSPDYLRQEWIGGEIEYSTHLLVIGGGVRRALSVSFHMANAHSIRGQDGVVLHRRCRSQHVPLLATMLQAIGFEGLCCVNYKLRDGVPVILEINPRFGFTLAPFFPAFVRSLDWTRSLGA